MQMPKGNLKKLINSEVVFYGLRNEEQGKKTVNLGIVQFEHPFLDSATPVSVLAEM